MLCIYIKKDLVKMYSFKNICLKNQLVLFIDYKLIISLGWCNAYFFVLYTPNGSYKYIRLSYFSNAIRL